VKAVSTHVTRRMGLPTATRFTFHPQMMVCLGEDLDWMLNASSSSSPLPNVGRNNVEDGSELVDYDADEGGDVFVNDENGGTP
jgi:hypothetical protein